MTVSRSDEHPVERPVPGEDLNPTSVNLAEYERLAAERDTADAKSTTPTTTKKDGATKR